MKTQQRPTSFQVNRRGFISALSAIIVSTFVWMLESCKVRKKHVVKIEGATHSRGHKLWKKEFPAPQEEREVDVLIVGGGVSALSAARILSKNGIQTTILELEDTLGGNSASGKNSTGSYPLGAHYLPLPNADCIELLDFLKEAGILLGVDASGKPIYNDYDLCFAPEARLLIHGYWQNGLLPQVGVPTADVEEIARFMKHMEEFKWKKGQDKKWWFAIPLDKSSADQEVRELDRILFSDWLHQHGYTSEYLNWYLSYCCRDDYGVGIDKVSAWAGIHYFACRKGTSTLGKEVSLLTWPEGNARLVNALKTQQKGTVESGQLVYTVSMYSSGPEVISFDCNRQQSIRWKAKQVIMATPHFINARILMMDVFEKNKSFTYSPWLIANLVVKNELNRNGASLSWDNVIYGSECLGYIYANHQDTQLHHDYVTITYYHPLDQLSPAQDRKAALFRTEEEWAEIVFENLKTAHPYIREICDSISVWVWGHGMIQPKPNVIWGEERKILQKPIKDKIFFAHSDLSGISIFEEAFYHGIRAANEVLHTRENV